MQIDWTKPVQTRNGIPVRILCTDGPHPVYPVLGVIEGRQYVDNWTKNGTFTGEQGHDLDLVNVLDIRGGWINFYEDGSCSAPHRSRGVADGAANIAKRIACIYVKYTVGEGL